MADTVNASIVEHFQTLEDPRIERTKKHLLLDILIIAVCTLLTGGEGFQDMELFGKNKRTMAPNLPGFTAWYPFPRYLWPRLCSSQSHVFSGVLSVMDPCGCGLSRRALLSRSTAKRSEPPLIGLPPPPPCIWSRRGVRRTAVLSWAN